jgi:starch synthase
LNRSLRVLLASSELYPYSKTGGLADMVGALAKYLSLAGHHVGVVTPLYKGIADEFSEIQAFDWDIKLPLGDSYPQAGIRILNVSKQLSIYFVDCPEFYSRNGIYQEGGVDIPDNAERFIFFAKCAVHLARYLPWKPEILHLHDWQVGPAVLFTRHQKQSDNWQDTPRTCFTIHNLAYQGVFPSSKYQLCNLPQDYYNMHGAEFFGQFNCLKCGIAYADQITTVSPSYAQEIRTKAFGCGLEGILDARRDSLIGILNGVDYDEWKTCNNPHLPYSYSEMDFRGKAYNKRSLQKELGLPGSADTPLFGTVTRLAEQKGCDVLLHSLEQTLASGMQFVLLGSGDQRLEKAYLAMQEKFPSQVAVRIAYNNPLAHRIEAGSDFFVMPSRYEPCGLNQMYSLRYGAIPIVRATGGLDDSIIDAAEDLNGANGLKFRELSKTALSQTIERALAIFDKAKVLRQYRRNGMRIDFSWERTAREYESIFMRLLNL